jgi:hypothetical protein
MTPQEIDKIVCDWSMRFGIAMPEAALNDLVDRMALAAAPPLHVGEKALFDSIIRDARNDGDSKDG